MRIAIGKIKEELQAAAIAELPVFIQTYADDTRAGVRKLVQMARKKKEDYDKEVERTRAMSVYEKEYGMYSYICGIDEVGRGPLAGPVVAGAVVLPKDCDIL